MDAILADMEGVIRDSKNAFHHGYEYALTSVGLRLVAYPDETWRLRGYHQFNHTRSFLKALYSITKSGEDLTRVFWKKYPTEYVNELIKKNGPNKEAMEKIENSYKKYILSPRVLRRIPPVRAGKIGVKLMKEDGYRVGVVTNSPSDYNTAWITHKKLHNHFDTVITADDVGMPKPAPDSILKACAKLGVKPKNTVYAGDTEADIMAAKNAGCIPIGIISGGTERRVLRELGAAYVFKNLTEFALWTRRGNKI